MPGVASWMLCSVAMMVLNKKAIGHFPYECTLTALQMLFSVAVLLCCFRYIYIGSMADFFRWCLVTPFFSGMLLTSMLALKHSSMTLVVVFRCLSPLFAMPIEWFYPKPLRISMAMLGAMLCMLLGACLYASQLPWDSLQGAWWVFLNMLLAIGDRLLQRLMLAKEQHPVNISRAGVALINNVMGFMVVAAVAVLEGEVPVAPRHLVELNQESMAYVLLSCLVSVGISYTGVWAQSLISATSFLMLVNANKFIIIFIEAFWQQLVINRLQLLGAVLAVGSSVAYGHSRQRLEQAEVKEGQLCREAAPILGKPCGYDGKFP